MLNKEQWLERKKATVALVMAAISTGMNTILEHREASVERAKERDALGEVLSPETIINDVEVALTVVDVIIATELAKLTEAQRQDALQTLVYEMTMQKYNDHYASEVEDVPQELLDIMKALKAKIQAAGASTTPSPARN